MTWQHFELIAGVVAEQHRLALTCERQGTVREIAYALTYALARTNGAFDRDKFLRACGVIR
jgi:hypothetical protein